MDLQLAAPTIAFALAVVATVAYVLGRRAGPSRRDFELGRRELQRAETVIRELEEISQKLRRSLATHQASILKFKERVSELSQQQNGAAWESLSEEAQHMLDPTIRLSAQIARAYDEIRQQANLLMTFTGARTDALTGLSNRRALEQTLESILAMQARYGSISAVAIFDIDSFQPVNEEHGHAYGDQVLRDFGQLLDQAARETDFVARFGGDEFVVLMPETDLAGARRLADRFRRRVESQLPVTVSAGVTPARRGDTVESLLSRADSSLYSAKSAGRNCVFQHTGDNIRRVESTRQCPESERGSSQQEGDEDAQLDAQQGDPQPEAAPTS